MRVKKYKIFYILSNMDNIIEPNESFDFSKISLAHPASIQGGAYFTKIEYNNKPLYIQTSKSLTKQGFVKTGRKYYCDLMFDKDSSILINWFENLESRCHKLIYEKKNDWFQGNLEENDIESAFNPLIRVYKSGKYYLLRSNVKNTKEDLPAIKIYNEKEIVLDINDITPETNIISILVMQGIKFTSRNFQIEIEIKQIMVLDNEPLFENCVIKTHKNNKTLDNNVDIDSNEKKQTEINKEFTENYPINDVEIIETNEETLGSQMIEEKNTKESINKINLDTLEEIESLDFLQSTKKDSENDVDINFEDLSEDICENNDELNEINNIDLSLDNNYPSITLKKPNQVYYEIYKEARNKAKQAKKNAILAYLEVKNIKKTYMIENMNDEDSDFDAEIDEVSESELEGL
jgi:hypothetical protein